MVNGEKRSKVFLEEFINLYRALPCLWEVKNPDYTDRAKKEEALQELVEKYKEVNPKANRVKVKAKIEYLRKTYRKEKRKVLYFKYFEKDSRRDYVPNLWYYDLLTFVDEENENENENETLLQSIKQDVLRQKAKKRKAKTADTDYLPTSKRWLSLDHENTHTNKTANKSKRIRSRWQSVDIDISANVKSEKSDSSVSGPNDNVSEGGQCTSTVRSPPHHNLSISFQSNESNIEVEPDIKPCAGDEGQCTSTVRSPPHHNLSISFQSNKSNIEVEPDIKPRAETSIDDAIDDDDIQIVSVTKKICQRKNGFKSNGVVNETQKNKNTSWTRSDEARDEDCHDVFGRNVACKLRAIPNDQRVYLEKMINDAIFAAELRNLNGQCYLHIPNPSVQESLPRNSQLKNEMG